MNCEAIIEKPETRCQYPATRSLMGMRLCDGHCEAFIKLAARDAFDEREWKDAGRTGARN